MKTSRQYGPLSQALHFLALGNDFIAKASFDIEQVLHKPDVESTINARHVFIAGLARAGTTVLLRRLYGTGQFTSLTYRDMPFLLMPNTWRKLSSTGSKPSRKHERIHGDGLMVDFDSPEALEEAFWRVFCKDVYIKNEGLVPMDANDETIENFRSYISAVTLPSPDKPYLSKNNNNIVRLPAIRKAFPNAVIVIPYRDPLQQAASLLNQHQRLAQSQTSDRFIVDYMNWLAHHEFGLGHKPFFFGRKKRHLDPQSIDYWLELWIHVYEWLETNAPKGSVFLNYEKFCRKNTEVWTTLTELIGIQQTVKDADEITINPPLNILADAVLTSESHRIYQRLASI